MGTTRKQRRSGIPEKRITDWEGPQSAVLVIAGDVGVYLMVVNIVDCLLSTVNFTKNIVKDSILRSACPTDVNTLNTGQLWSPALTDKAAFLHSLHMKS